MYELQFTAAYEAEIAAIDAGTGQLGIRLEEGLYRILRRDPMRGSYSQVYDLWIMRQAVFPGVLAVQVYTASTRWTGG